MMHTRVYVYLSLSLSLCVCVCVCVRVRACVRAYMRITSWRDKGRVRYASVRVRALCVCVCVCVRAYVRDACVYVCGLTLNLTVNRKLNP